MTRSAPIPIACTLPAEQLPDRLADWRDVVGRATRREGATLHFDADPELAARIGALAAAEQTCCAFFTFAITIGADGTTLTVTAPEEAAPLVDALLAAS